jgi:ATP-dependent Clp protease ATP-binding subunit ClpA
VNLKAAEEARRLRHNWLGPCHYLLALAAEPSLATEAMAELGLTRDRLAEGFGPMNTVNGRRIRYFKSKWITPNPAAYDVIGWAMGFAAASGRQKPNPEDWLLSIIYRNNGMVGSVQHGLGVSSAAIIDALRRRGGSRSRTSSQKSTDPGAATAPWRSRGHKLRRLSTRSTRSTRAGSEWR